MTESRPGTCPRCGSDLVYCAWFLAYKKNVYRCGACGWGFIR